MTGAFVALDRDWVYLYVNRRAGEMFGRAPKELARREHRYRVLAHAFSSVVWDWLEAIHPDEAPGVKAAWDASAIRRCRICTAADLPGALADALRRAGS